MKMNKGYWVVAYRSVSDEVALKAYSKLAKVAIDAGGGTVPVFSMDPTVHEAGLKQLTVIVEFPSFAVAQQVYDGEAYQAALRALGSAAERDFRIVEALAPSA
jgi:uncharacterized protein (DUF1330 family)